jgi:hypothetical protein
MGSRLATVENNWEWLTGYTSITAFNPRFSGICGSMADHSPEARERYFKRYTTVVSVSAGSGVGSP